MRRPEPAAWAPVDPAPQAADQAAAVRSARTALSDAAPPGGQNPPKSSDSSPSSAFVRTPDMTLPPTAPASPTQPETLTPTGQRAAEASLLLQQVDGGRTQRDGGVMLLRLIGAVLSHPDEEMRACAAQQLQLATGRRRGLVPLMNAAMRQIEIRVAVKDEVVGAWMAATTPPPSAAAPGLPEAQTAAARSAAHQVAALLG